MTTVWKFPLEIVDLQQVAMPKNAKILCVQTQDNRPCIWAEVKPLAFGENRTFRMLGTGHSIDHDLALSYIGTCQMDLGRGLVWHVYESRE